MREQYPLVLGPGGRPQARVGRQVFTFVGTFAVLQIGHAAVIYGRWHSRCPDCGRHYTFVTKHFRPRQHGCVGKRPDRGEAA
jgi:hypothetical protein